SAAKPNRGRIPSSACAFPSSQAPDTSLLVSGLHAQAVGLQELGVAVQLLAVYVGEQAVIAHDYVILRRTVDLQRSGVVPFPILDAGALPRQARRLRVVQRQQLASTHLLHQRSRRTAALQLQKMLVNGI